MAMKFELAFSPNKCQLLSLKGGLKPGYSVCCGSKRDAQRIESSGTSKYLGVILDPRQSYWDHISQLRDKSSDMYSRLRRMTSANWGMGRQAPKVVNEAVFLPRVTYAAEIWAKGCSMKKSIKILCRMQRALLLAITSCYKTVSTNALTAVAGVLPLDLEIRRVVAKGKLKNGETNSTEYNSEINELMNVWQARYAVEDKGEWTKKMIPDVRLRSSLSITLDHYTSQMLTGYGDFRAQLFRFKLVNSPNCKCAVGGAETVAHVLLRCHRTEEHRRKLISTLREENKNWPPRDGVFLKSKKTYEALRIFAKISLSNRSDR